MSVGFSAVEEALIRDLLAGRSSQWADLHDDLHLRIRDVLDGVSGRSSDRDLAVLIRQWLRRLTERDGAVYRATISAEIEDRIHPQAPETGLSNTMGPWQAQPFVPSWSHSDIPVDRASLAGTHLGMPTQTLEIKADPWFTRLTRWPTYRSPGQRAAARAAATMVDGTTLITMLPTGTGKTEVALCLADRGQGAVTLIVVPTVALAYDFERRFQDHYMRLLPGADRENLRFAWTATTDAEERQRFRRFLSQGKQPLLVTSPESLTTALRSQLFDLATLGRLAGFVVDEAHLVTQWGRSFRPQFRTFALLRSELMDATKAHSRRAPVTLLLSATFNSECLEDLHSLFGKPGPCTLLAANTLRPEPEFWVAPETDEVARVETVMEAVNHLPRPLVLYVTKPEEAQAWKSRLHEVGFERLTAVTGESKPGERQDALEGLRTDGISPSRYDIIIGTSAFGLGIDYGHIRSIVHACIPETVDRWYQEVGRGGRDQNYSTALLCPATSDWEVAESLGVTVLKPETASRKWKDLWRHRRAFGNAYAFDLNRPTGRAQEGSYNLRWNNQLVQGMIELGAMDSVLVLEDDAVELSGNDERDHLWCAAKVFQSGLDKDAWWANTWGPWQLREMSRSDRSLSRLKATIDGRLPVCQAIADEYTPTGATYTLLGLGAAMMEPAAGCGRCPSCRAKGAPAYYESPPAPQQSWATACGDLSELRTFIDAVGTDTGLAVVVAEDPQGFVLDFADRLIAMGLRHFSGCPVPPTPAVIFHDESAIQPDQLTPFPSVVAMSSGELARSTWLNLAARARNRSHQEDVLDVLVVSPHVRLPKGLRVRGAQTCRTLLASGN